MDVDEDAAAVGLPLAVEDAPADPHAPTGMQVFQQAHWLQYTVPHAAAEAAEAALAAARSLEAGATAALDVAAERAGWAEHVAQNVEVGSLG
jgi:hypothetical protein